MPSTNLTALSPKTKSFTKQKKVNIFPVKFEHYNPPNQYDLKPLTSRISVSILKIISIQKCFLGKFQTKRVERILERAYIYFPWSRRVYSIKR
jgi:hypothetical protein